MSVNIGARDDCDYIVSRFNETAYYLCAFHTTINFHSSRTWHGPINGRKFYSAITIIRSAFVIELHCAQKKQSIKESGSRAVKTCTKSMLHV
eukprot:6179862-Pleurochrysis_carterae.AAC.1